MTVVFTVSTANVDIYDCEIGLSENRCVFVVASQLLWGDTSLCSDAHAEPREGFDVEDCRGQAGPVQPAWWPPRGKERRSTARRARPGPRPF